MEDVIRKRALSGDMDALKGLTQKLIKRKTAENVMAAFNMVTDAYNNMPSVAVELGNQLLKGSDLFEQDRDIAFTWMAFAGDPKTLVPPAGTTEQNPPQQQGSSPGKKDTLSFRRIEPSPDLDPHQELNTLVGLENVKQEIAVQTSRMEFGKLRKKSGLPALTPSAHFVFTGNPGTGKTTVARIFGSLLKKIGHLESGHVVEVSVPELIGQFVGETPQKVLAALQAAVGGVLFIDEAYGLLSSEIGRGDAFGEQAITTLLKFMEDNRDNITIIAAGYPDKMGKFMESNPGFKSRFSEVISFEDYTQDDLFKIYLSMAESQYYKLSSTATLNLFAMMGEAPKLFEKDFPNGRFVRSLFEDTVKYMALRVMKIKGPSRKDLVTMTEEDLNHAFNEAQKVARAHSGQSSESGGRDEENYGYQ